MEERISTLRAEHPDNEEAQTQANRSQREIDMWKNHGNDYGYVFYIGQKID